MATKRFLALDIGASTLKLAEFISTGNGNLTLVNFGQAPLAIDPTSSDENRNPYITTALQMLMASHPFKSRHMAISVSGQIVLTRFMKLPAADEAKVRQMVRYEAAQNVPFPIEEVIWDYQVVGDKDAPDLEVVLVAIKSQIIEGFDAVIEKIGFEIELVDVAPLTIYNAILFNYEVKEGCTLLLDIGARTTNLIFIEPKKLFARSILIAGNTITQNIAQELEISFAEAEALKLREGFVGLGGAYEEPESETSARLSKIIRNTMTRLHAEIARSINFYKSQQNGTPPQRLLLAGGTSNIPYIEHFFKEKMEIEVEYFNPFKNVPIQVSREELAKVAHMMGEAVGLGLRLVTECPIEINLLPPSITKRRQFMRKVPFFVASMLGVLFLILSWWLYYWKVTQLLSRHRSAVIQELDQLTQTESKLNEAEKWSTLVRLETEQIQQVFKGRYFWLEFLEDLNRRVSFDIWITQLTPENNQQPILFSSAASTTTPSRDDVRSRRLSLLQPETIPAQESSNASKKGAVPLQNVITEFEIRGLCLNNPNSARPYKPIDDFLDNLSQSPYYREVRILEQGNPDPKDWTFAFRIRAKLKNPIPY